MGNPGHLHNFLHKQNTGRRLVSAMPFRRRFSDTGGLRWGSSLLRGMRSSQRRHSGHDELQTSHSSRPQSIYHEPIVPIAQVESHNVEESKGVEKHSINFVTKSKRIVVEVNVRSIDEEEYTEPGTTQILKQPLRLEIGTEKPQFEPFLYTRSDRKTSACSLERADACSLAKAWNDAENPSIPILRIPAGPKYEEDHEDASTKLSQQSERENSVATSVGSSSGFRIIRSSVEEDASRSFRRSRMLRQPSIVSLPSTMTHQSKENVGSIKETRRSVFESRTSHSLRSLSPNFSPLVPPKPKLREPATISDHSQISLSDASESSGVGTHSAPKYAGRKSSLQVAATSPVASSLAALRMTPNRDHRSIRSRSSIDHHKSVSHIEIGKESADRIMKMHYSFPSRAADLPPPRMINSLRDHRSEMMVNRSPKSYEDAAKLSRKCPPASSIDSRQQSLVFEASHNTLQNDSPCRSNESLSTSHNQSRTTPSASTRNFQRPSSKSDYSPGSPRGRSRRARKKPGKSETSSRSKRKGRKKKRDSTPPVYNRKRSSSRRSMSARNLGTEMSNEKVDEGSPNSVVSSGLVDHLNEITCDTPGSTSSKHSESSGSRWGRLDHQFPPLPLHNSSSLSTGEWLADLS